MHRFFNLPQSDLSNSHKTEATALSDPTMSRASFYAFLSIHFMQLPDSYFVGILRSEAYLEILKEVAQSSAAHSEIAKGAAMMHADLAHTASIDDTDMAVRLGIDRTLLYRGVSPHHGPKPPFEALWVGDEKQNGVFQKLAATYAHSGFVLKKDIHERLDYIGIQMNFIEGLLIDELSARQASNQQAICSIQNRRWEFISTHFGNWVPQYISCAMNYARTDFYRGHLLMLKGFTEQEMAAIGKNSIG